MEPQDLRSRLEGLHHELSQQPDLDERGQQVLAGVREDIARLDANAPSTQEREQIQSRWQSAVVDFENSHPQLAQGLERMAVILSNFGL